MVSKVTKLVDLTLIDQFNELNRSNKKEAKIEIGNFIKEAILDYVGSGSSPVQNGEWQKSLSPEYKKKKKQYSSVGYANLELKGNMLDSLKFENRTNGIEIGIFSSKEALKAEGHNIGGGYLPVRRFIPLENEKFKRSIESEIKNIIKEYHDGQNKDIS